ncbi:MAG: SusC/RagA family TonB-linked outer membrane protein [Bacteroidales bacterium]
MKKLIMIMVIVLLCSFQAALSQRSISGKVTDAKDGVALTGVTVVVKGLTVGTSTDEDGNYRLSVPAGSNTLVYSMIGYNDYEVTLGSSNTYDVALEPATELIEDVVVTALGIKRDKKALGYSVSSIKAAEITVAGTPQNALASLYGKAAGVGIQLGTAGPTGGVNIKIRGSAGLDVSTKTRPLFVVDGVPIFDENSNMANRGYDPLNSPDYGTGINDINSEDIESIEILKGAKATVLYGSRAGNGVVMITTKKGQSTRGLGVTLSYQNTFEQPVNTIDWQNEFGSGTSIYDTIYGTNKLGQTVRVMNNSRFQFGPAFDNSPIMNYDSTMTTYKAYPDNWINMFRKTNTNSLTAAIAGANEKGAMRLAFTTRDYNGMQENFYQKTNSVSFSGQINASELATFEVYTNIHKVKTQNRYQNLGRLVSYGFNRDLDYQGLKYLYKDKFGQKAVLDDYGFPMSFDQYGYMNLLWDQLENRDIDDKLHMTGAIKMNLQFTPWLSLTANAGTDFTDWDFTTMNKVTKLMPVVEGGGYEFSRRNIVNMNYNAFLNFTKKFMNDKLDVVIFAGPELTTFNETNIGVSTVGGLQFDGWYSLNGSKTTTGSFYQTRSHNRSSFTNYSILGQASFGWESTYYVEFTARNDWSSLLPPSNNSYFYPGISATWNFSQTFSIPQLTYGKLRMSFADVGRAAPTPYWTNRDYGVGMVERTNAITVYGPSALFTSDIKNERKREFEIGFDTRWFEKKPLVAEFSYYTSHTYDQIMGLGITPASGFSTIKINAGDVKNWGYELLLKYTPVRTEKLTWDVTFTTANQRTKVVKLYPGMTEYRIAGTNSYSIMAVEGEPIGDVKMYDYLRDNQGNKIVNSSGLYVRDNANFVTAANINPNFIGGLTTDLYYGKVSLHLGFDYKFGGTFLSHTNYYLLGNGQNVESLKYRDEANGGLAYYVDDATGNRIPWQHNQAAPTGARDNMVYHDGLILEGVKEVSDGVYTDNDIIVTAIEYWSTYIQDMNEWFAPDKLYKNDYVKLREAAIMYTIPQQISSKLKLQKLTVSFVARNLFYIYKTMPNIDPESLLGNDQFVEYTPLPQLRSYGFKIDVSF